MSKSAGAVKGGASGARERVTTVAGAVKRPPAAGDVKDGASAAAGAVKDGASAAAGAAKGGVSKAAGAVKGGASKAAGAVKGGASAAAGAVKGIFSLESMRDKLIDGADVACDSARGGASAARDALSEGREAAISSVSLGDRRGGTLLSELSINLYDVSRAVPVTCETNGDTSVVGMESSLTVRLVVHPDADLELCFSPRDRFTGATLCRAWPTSIDLEARVKVWWHLKSGTLKCAFLSSNPPQCELGASRIDAGPCAIPPSFVSFLVAKIVRRVLLSYDDASPMNIPFAAPPGIHIGSKLADEGSSLASMSGQVKEAVRVLKGMTTCSPEHAIPKNLLKKAQGLVIATQVTMGFGITATVGCGILVQRQLDGGWSGPVSIMSMGAGAGMSVGGRKTELLLLLFSRKAIRAFTGVGQVKIGADVAVAAGPIGREAAADLRVGDGGVTACMSYCNAKGLFAGYSLGGAVFSVRKVDNEEFYGKRGLRADDILGQPAYRTVTGKRAEEARDLYALLDEATGVPDGLSSSVEGSRRDEGHGARPFAAVLDVLQSAARACAASFQQLTASQDPDDSSQAGTASTGSTGNLPVERLGAVTGAAVSAARKMTKI